MQEELNTILDKVRCLFMRYGIKSITMDDISRELGISKKTLYQYVSNKEDLVEKVLEFIHCYYHKDDESLEQYQNLNAIEILMKVNDLVSNIIRDHNPSMQYDLKKYYPHIASKFYQQRNKEIYEAIIKNIEKGKIEGVYRQEVNGELVAKLYINRIISITDDDVFTLKEVQSTNFFLSIMELHIRSLATLKGVAILEKELQRYNN